MNLDTSAGDEGVVKETGRALPLNFLLVY